MGPRNTSRQSVGHSINHMTFFDFSPERLLKLSLIMGVLLFCTAAFLTLQGHLTITHFNDSVESAIGKAGATTAYWWSYKIFTPERNFKESLALVGFAYPSMLSYKTFTEAFKGSVALGDETEGAARSIPVLLYHGESDGGYNIPHSAFVEQMKELKQNGWQTITLEELRAFMQDRRPIPQKSFLLTFDDGRKDSYYPTDPALRDLGFNAVMFAVTSSGYSFPQPGSTRSSFYLNETELRQMQSSGRWDIESHGKEDHYFYTVDENGTEGHFISNKLWLAQEKRLETTEEFIERISYDLRNSKEVLENALGTPVLSFAYPYSDYGQDTMNFEEARGIVDDVVSSTYQLAFYQVRSEDGDTWNYSDPNVYMIKRFEPLPTWTGKDLLEKLEGGSPKNFPYVQTDTFASEWRKTWGGVTGGRALALDALPDTTGAATFLDGSGWWKNYVVTAHIDWKSGESVTLMARHKNTSTYVDCAFSSGRVAIRQHINKAITEVAKEVYDGPTSGEVRLGIAVEGNAVGCYANGERVLVGSMSPVLVSGGTGIQIWDKKEGAAHIEVLRVTAETLR